MSTELQKIHCLETKVRGLEKKLEDTDELDRNNERFPGILIWRSVGESIDDAVESLFNGWNKRKADELLHNVQDLFWHISEDRANPCQLPTDESLGFHRHE